MSQSPNTSDDAWNTWFSNKVETAQNETLVGNLISQDEAEARAKARRDKLCKKYQPLSHSPL